MNDLPNDNRPAFRNEVHLLQEALRRACASAWNKGSCAKELLAAIAAERENGPRDRPDPVRAAKDSAA